MSCTQWIDRWPVPAAGIALALLYWHAGVAQAPQPVAPKSPRSSPAAHVLRNKLHPITPVTADVAAPQAAAPAFSLSPGTYSTTQVVSLSDSTPGAAIYYTITGFVVAPPPALYSGPITVASSETIHAVAIATGYSRSQAASAAYTIAPTAAAPTFSVPSGNYTSSQFVSIAATPGAAIYYTVTGNVVSLPSVLFTGPITISSSETLNAIAIAPGFSQSPSASVSYIITPPAPPPQILPAGGIYAAAQMVSIVPPIPGASIFYTTDGTIPTAAAAPYTGPIAVMSSKVIRAIAIVSGYSPSPATSVTFSIQSPLNLTLPSVLPQAFAGAPYSAAIQASGEGPNYTWTVNGAVIPANSAPVQISSGITVSTNGSFALDVGGKPSSPGSIMLSVTVIDNYTGDQAGPVTVAIPVSLASPLLLPAPNPSSLGPAMAHVRYMGFVGVSGGVPPYTWTVTGLAATLIAPTSTLISTLAGAGIAGYSGDGGPASAAQINPAGGAAVDLMGDIYFSDPASAVVRRIDASGNISTVAGTGVAGFNGDNLPASQAQLANPIGLAVDRAGNLYIADAGNERIREVNAQTGVITTVAGTGTQGFSGDGFAAFVAQLNWPTGVAVDFLGNLFIADSGNSRIRQVSAMTGNISTVAGTETPGFSGDSGPAALAQLNNPYAVAVDLSDNLYVADLAGVSGAAGTGGRIRFVAAGSGIITTVAGNGVAGFNGDGIAAIDANLNNPIAIAVDPGANLLIADFGNNRIRIVSPNGVIATIAGTGSAAFNGDGIPAVMANVASPLAVAADSAGNLYVADSSSRIRFIQTHASASQLVVQGTPPSAGVIAFQASVQDAAGSIAGPVSYSIPVAAPLPLALPLPNPASLPSAVAGVPYQGAILVSGGVPNYSWVVDGGMIPSTGTLVALPGGLSVSSDGSNTLTVRFTPEAAGAFTFSAAVKDGMGNVTAYIAYSIQAMSSPGSTLSGQVNFVNCGAPVTGVAVTISTNPAQVVSTDSNGRFAFQNVPNGSFTLTPTVAAPSSAFYPAIQTVAVNSTPVEGINFQASIGYAVSGSVGYTDGIGGRIYLSLLSTSCTVPALGTSIIAPQRFTIRGVPPGVYTLNAWVDELGYGALNASDPTVTLSGLTVGSAGLANVSISFTPPPPVTLVSPPTILYGGGFSGGAVLGYQPIVDSNGIEQAASYLIQWSTSPAFTSVTGSRTFTASGTAGARAWFLNSLGSGSKFYFRAQGVAGNSTSPWSNVFGPFTIGIPFAGSTVSGTISFANPVKGALYVGFRDLASGETYAQIILRPVSPQSYSIKVPTGSSYAMFALIDQNGDGMPSNIDINGLNEGTVVSVAGNTTQDLVMPQGNSATVTTQHFRQASSGGLVESYGLAFSIPTTNLLPLDVSLISGPNIPVPMDVGECLSCAASPYGFWMSLSGTVPNSGDSYVLTITDPSGIVAPGWSLGPIVDVAASVTGVVNAFAAGLSPGGIAGAGTTPTFTWADPPGADAFTYQFTLWDANGNIVWQIPAANASFTGFSSAVTSIAWGVDPTGAANPPSVPAFTAGETYTWSIQVQDANGNTAEAPVSFTP
jgi:hypothetical protein